MKLTLKRFLICLLVVSLSFFVFLPPGQNEKLGGTGDTTGDCAVSCSSESGVEEIKISSRLYELLFGKEEETKKLLLLPGGGIFGAKIKQSYVSVQNPGDNKELKVGDKIKSVNGSKVCSVKEIKKLASSLGGENVTLLCERDGKEISVKVTPKEVDGEYRLGIVLKDGAAGIGTITYIDP